MGTFAEFIGTMDIPEDDRAEYAQQMLKLLQAGGMMSVQEVQLYGKRLRFLSPPEFDESGHAWGSYNYFEKDFWEDWSLDAKAGTFGSNKIGGGAFHVVVVAAYVLTALHCKSYGVVTVDGDPVREHFCLGWINDVLGTSYTNQRATQLWEIAKLLHTESWYERHNDDLIPLLDDVPEECVDMAQIESYMAACHLEDFLGEMAAAPVDEKTLREEKTISPRVRYDCLQNTLEELRKDGGTLEDAKRFLTMTMDERRDYIKNHGGNNLAFAYSLVSPVFAVAMTAKKFNMDFWQLWEEKGADILEIELFPKPQPCPPVEPISTQDFLRVSPDDMAYYWTPDGKIEFSAEMQTWMKGLRDELDSITEDIPQEGFLKALVDAIAATGELAFRDMFYEFIARQAEPRMQAAVILMQRLAARKEPNIRRYLAVLGNTVLRHEAFEF